MEIPSRAIPSQRSLKRIALAAAPLAVVVVAAVVLVAAQPVTGPWWINADADATYSASALNIISGDRSRYFDHPGLPNQEILAITFGAVSLAHGGPTRAWAQDEMAHLDSARPVFRGWGIAFFIGGALLVYLLLNRLFGHWTWGLAGGLLWLAQPDTTDAIQIRPDVLLCALLLATGFVVVRAWQRRSAGGFAAASALAGFALMTKLHAVAIIPMILLGTVLGYPGAAWREKLKTDVRSFVVRHRRGVAIAVGVWILLFFILNWHRLTISTLGIDAGLLALIAFAVFDYWLLTTLVHKWTGARLVRRVFDPFYVWLAGAFALGIAIPLALVLEYSPWILSQTFQSLIGRNVNAGITPFKLSVTQFTSFPLLEAMIVIGISVVAAVVGVVRRDAFPAIWFVGAAATTLLATVRLGENRYYAPGYVLAIPAALWLFRRRGAAAAPIVVWALAVGILVPTFLHMRDAAHAASAAESQSRATTALADKVLSPGEVALVPNYYWPVADARWWGLVHQYVFSAPDYPYRFIPDEADAIPAATDEGKHVAAYIGSSALEVGNRQSLQLGSGTFEAEPVPGGRDYASVDLGVVRLLSGPGT